MVDLENQICPYNSCKSKQILQLLDEQQPKATHLTGMKMWMNTPTITKINRLISKY